MAHWVEDLALLQLWHRSQPWLEFEPRSGNFHRLQVWPKKKKKKKKKRKEKGKKFVVYHDSFLYNLVEWTNIYFLKFVFFRAAPTAYGDSQAGVKLEL